MSLGDAITFWIGRAFAEVFLFFGLIIGGLLFWEAIKIVCKIIDFFKGTKP